MSMPLEGDLTITNLQFAILAASTGATNLILV